MVIPYRKKEAEEFITKLPDRLLIATAAKRSITTYSPRFIFSPSQSPEMNKELDLIDLSDGIHTPEVNDVEQGKSIIAGSEIDMDKNESLTICCDSNTIDFLLGNTMPIETVDDDDVFAIFSMPQVSGDFVVTPTVTETCNTIDYDSLIQFDDVEPTVQSIPNQQNNLAIEKPNSDLLDISEHLECPSDKHSNKSITNNSININSNDLNESNLIVLKTDSDGDQRIQPTNRMVDVSDDSILDTKSADGNNLVSTETVTLLERGNELWGACAPNKSHTIASSSSPILFKRNNSGAGCTPAVYIANFNSSIEKDFIQVDKNFLAVVNQTLLLPNLITNNHNIEFNCNTSDENNKESVLAPLSTSVSENKCVENQEFGGHELVKLNGDCNINENFPDTNELSVSNLNGINNSIQPNGLDVSNLETIDIISDLIDLENSCEPNESIKYLQGQQINENTKKCCVSLNIKLRTYEQPSIDSTSIKGVDNPLSIVLDSVQSVNNNNNNCEVLIKNLKNSIDEPNHIEKNVPHVIECKEKISDSVETTVSAPLKENFKDVVVNNHIASDYQTENSLDDEKSGNSDSLLINLSSDTNGLPNSDKFNTVDLKNKDICNDNFIASNRLKRLEERFKTLTDTNKTVFNTTNPTTTNVLVETPLNYELSDEGLNGVYDDNDTALLINDLPVTENFEDISATQLHSEKVDDPLTYTDATNLTDNLEQIPIVPLDYSQVNTVCEFNANNFINSLIDIAVPLQCYDEFDDETTALNQQNLNDENPIKLSFSDYPFSGVPLSETLAMRETTGQLRSLLKKPNRQPPARKNRVNFDETKNKFFDADYIILIREDCQFEEEDDEPCTCCSHEVVRICCDEGCDCSNYSDGSVKGGQLTAKYGGAVEFVDQTTLSPPEGYKDGSALDAALSGALGNHVFGAQHIQQLQVIQKLQQQRAAMLAARAAAEQQQQLSQQHNLPTSAVCSQCVDCAQCAAMQMQEENITPNDEHLAVPHVTLVPINTSSPEHRITQKEIIAGEERPKYLLIKQQDSMKTEQTSINYHVETITMATITERRLIKSTPIETKGTLINPAVPLGNPTGGNKDSTDATSNQIKPNENSTSTETKSPKDFALYGTIDSNKRPTIAAQITGILKGGKLWRTEHSADNESSNGTSDDDSSSRRSVRFTELPENSGETKENEDGGNGNEDDDSEHKAIENCTTQMMRKHVSIFHNALRPNSAVRQLFPTTAQGPLPINAPLTQESLKAFEDEKKIPLTSSSSVSSTSDTDTIRRTIERNALRRSLIKKKNQKSEPSLEERIRQLTCNIDEPLSTDMDEKSGGDGDSSSDLYCGSDLQDRSSPTGEESMHTVKTIADKEFTSNNTVMNTVGLASGSYKKITEMFSKDKKQNRNSDGDNPIVIVPQDCRCPAAPDLGMGVQMPMAHTQVHQTPLRQNEGRRPFLAPLTACVAGQRDDLSYYALAPNDGNSISSSPYSLRDIDVGLQDDEKKKIAPDVIAGTPGQEQDELVNFAKQEAQRTEKLKKRYSGTGTKSSNTKPEEDEDDEKNDYGFNQRPSVRGIKPRFSSTNEILQEMQAQLSQTSNTNQTQTIQTNAQATNTLPKMYPQQMQITAKQQTAAAWNYYSITPTQQTINAGYYQQMPTPQQRMGYPVPDESALYQNCQAMQMEDPYGTMSSLYARSPTRRPESPPPLRNYHQNIVLIPYNTESYSQFTDERHMPGAHFAATNVLEYQQVTQQTIRVPVGYQLPGMQLHVVAGRGTTTAHTATHHFAQYTRHQHAPRNFAYGPPGDPAAIKFSERGVPEGAASVQLVDNNTMISPNMMTNLNPGNPNQQQQQQNHDQQQQTQNMQHLIGCDQNDGKPHHFYPMNV